MPALLQIPKPLKISAGIILVILLGLLDTLSGPELSFSVFYMLPIYLVTWHVGRWPGVGISVLSALTWLAADYAAGHTVSHSLIPIWNMIVRLAFFLLMTYLLSALQQNEQRRRILERVFFHDILNLVGSIRGFAEVLKDQDVPASQEVYDLIYRAADRSLEDIEAQRALVNAENNELQIDPVEISSRWLMDLLVNLYNHNKVANGRTIVITEDTEDILFVTDQSIISRVLGNMLKNALEASPEGGIVTFRCQKEQGKVCFSVHNQAVIPSSVRGQIFRQATTTKGTGRGLGTYSMKLLTDCLHGKISFTSSKQHGTSFKACYPLTSTDW